MNPILEHRYADDDVVLRRQKRGFPRLTNVAEEYLAFLHMEMAQCWLQGLDHAAILTACSLIEYTVKNALYAKKFVDDQCVFDRRVWDEIDGLDYSKAINWAKSQGVVTKDEWTFLEHVRDKIRNHYMHGATPDWLKDMHAPGVISADLATGEWKQHTAPLGDDLPLQRVFRMIADRNTCNQFVPRTHDIVDAISSRASKRLDDWRTANPTPAPTAEMFERVVRNIREAGHEPGLAVMSEGLVNALMREKPQGGVQT